MRLGNEYSAQSLIQSSEDNFSGNGIGIVHFGVGAFHRAHQAVYTHDVLVKHGGDWRILGVSLQSTETVDALNFQDGIYSLIVRGEKKSTLRIIESIKHTVAAARGTDQLFKYLASPQTRIVSMTVTEKAYGILREAEKVDIKHESIAYDLANPDTPKGIIGIITKGLKLRKEKGLNPFTVMCCDNLPQNGDLIRAGVIDFARHINQPELAEWIIKVGAFPNSMVDRITPATTPKLIDETSKLLGAEDLVPIETEPFSQWVVEENFSDGRPKWEDVGVLFVDDVAPYEHMKLRMLNGAHSLIAYIGFCSGHKYVRDAMVDKTITQLVETHMIAASKTLAPLGNIKFDAYSKELIERFKNQNIEHETYQIAMDGSQKMPQRIFEPAVDSLHLGLSIEPFAFATAAWIFYCSGKHKEGSSYALRDPREAELISAFNSGDGISYNICNAFFELPDLFPIELIENSKWNTAVTNYLKTMMG